VILQERQSGLLVPVTKPEPPPEHPVRQVIRDSMAKLAVELEEFTHTTHGVLSGGKMDSVGSALVECYEQPSAYTISTLYQVIEQLLAKAGGGK